jgi:hypothetical protein
MDRVQRRELKLKVLLTPDEIAAVDEFRVKQRMPSRAAAARILFNERCALTAKQSPPFADSIMCSTTCPRHTRCYRGGASIGRSHACLSPAGRYAGRYREPDRPTATFVSSLFLVVDSQIEKQDEE